MKMSCTGRKYSAGAFDDKDTRSAPDRESACVLNVHARSKSCQVKVARIPSCEVYFA